MAKSNKSGISQGNGYVSRKWWMGIIGMALLSALFLFFPTRTAEPLAFPICLIVVVYIAFQSFTDAVAEKYGAKGAEEPEEE